MIQDRFSKNRRGWRPTPTDYLLVFQQLEDGIWHEISCNLPQYENMILADYLTIMGVNIPDGCTFCRCRWNNVRWEFRQNGGIIRVYYDIIKEV